MPECGHRTTAQRCYSHGALQQSKQFLECLRHFLLKRCKAPISSRTRIVSTPLFTREESDKSTRLTLLATQPIKYLVEQSLYTSALPLIIRTATAVCLAGTSDSIDGHGIMNTITHPCLLLLSHCMRYDTHKAETKEKKNVVRTIGVHHTPPTCKDKSFDEIFDLNTYYGGP